MARINDNIFKKASPINLDNEKYRLSRSTPDYSNLAQFQLYESGYSVLVVCSIPKFLERLGDKDSNVKNMVDTYKKILELDFRGLDGIDNITVDTGDITDGISTLQMINKVTMQSGSNFSMRYQERAGSLLTKVHELFLTGVKDPRTQIKHYHGLIESGDLESSFENEVFSFLYFVTDNTMTKLEKAYYIIGAQPTTAETNIYNSEKGSIEFKEITCEFSGFPITGKAVDNAALSYLKYLHDPKNPYQLIPDSQKMVAQISGDDRDSDEVAKTYTKTEKSDILPTNTPAEYK